MTVPRYQLRALLADAWQETIEAYYNQRLINSERSLQLYLCASIERRYKDRSLTRTFLVEQMLTRKDGRRIAPDILLCNSRSVVAAFELKYRPRGRLTQDSMRKDMATLAWLAEDKDKLQVFNDRYSGNAKQVTLRIAPDAVMCWAGVYRGEKVALPPVAKATMGNRFMEMHALTRKTTDPEILVPTLRQLQTV